MVKTVKTRNQQVEEDDGEFDSRNSDGSSQKEGKRGDRRSNANRSKHSETEQRRRSKINERFQVLRDLIPENDQKRDKASFLLEVIQYIQFLNEKVQMYEGTHQGWSPEPSKLIPWRNNRGPADSFIDESQLVKNGSVYEGKAVVTAAIPANAHNSIDSDFSGEAAYKATDHGAATQTFPINIPLQTNLFEGAVVQPSEGSFHEADHLTSQSQPPLWHARSCTAECASPSYAPIEQEELKIENGGAISNACSQGLLNTLTHVLESSGVDLSKTSISVQLDIGKRKNSGMKSSAIGTKDQENSFPSNQSMAHYGVRSNDEDSDQANKRLRTEQS